MASGRTDVIDGYATRAQARQLEDEFFLVRDLHGNVTLRTTSVSTQTLQWPMRWRSLWT